MKIWILTQIANDYNQPENDLVAWWPEKPTKEQVGAAINWEYDSEPVKHIHESGYYNFPYGNTFYLWEVGPGRIYDQRN